jgi:[histone H3]-lysine36 N-dimethyltransferase SETMAR
MTLFEHLNDEIKKQTAQFEEKKALFHQDNAPVHKSIKTTAKLHELGYELLPHPTYSPDLASSDFFLFVNLKRMLARKKFSTNEEVIAENRNRTIKMVSKIFLFPHVCQFFL